MLRPFAALLLATAATAGTAHAAGGSLKGSVVLKGKAPEAKEVNMKADPFCAKAPMKDERCRGRRAAASRTSSFASPRAPPAPTTAPAAAVTVDQSGLHVPPARAGHRAGQASDQEQRPDAAQRAQLQGRVDAVQPGADPGHAADREEVRRRRRDRQVQVRRPPVDDRLRGGRRTTRSSRSPATTASSRSRGVPPGKYTVEAWHEKLGTKKAEITSGRRQAGRDEVEFTGAEWSGPP